MYMPNLSPAKPESTVVAAGSAKFQGYSAFGLGATFRSPIGQVLVNGALAYSNSRGTAARVQFGYEF
jgi:trimeric autotransporter adhesin